MKKRITQQVRVEINICNICKKEVTYGSYETWLNRVIFVRGLLKTNNFDAHAACLNRVAREAFMPFLK